MQHLLTDARRRLEALYGERLRHVVLYSSQARGEASPESDVDVLVVLTGPVDLYAETGRLARLQMKLFETHRLDVSLVPYDEAAYEARERSFVRHVHEEGVEL